MEGGKYPVELVEVRASWPGHHGYQKEKNCFPLYQLKLLNETDHTIQLNELTK